MKADGKLILVLIIIAGFVVHYMNSMRSVGGIQTWYSDPILITSAQIADTVFFGLISGYVIAKILGKR